MSTFSANNITRRAFYQVIDRIGDFERYVNENYLSDLHNELFNMDYEYIYYEDARNDLNEYDVFEAIEEIKEYEEFNFGEVNTDFSNPCDVANMLFYIIGEKVIYDFIAGIIEEHEEEEPEEIINLIVKACKEQAA